jgi:hypothetical protein
MKLEDVLNESLDDLLREALQEDKDQNKDGKNDFDDVKIARMKASGMSDEEIRKKHPDLFAESDELPASYKAKKGTKRGDKLRKLTDRYKNAKTEKEKEAARKARDRYEEEIAKKNTYGKPKKSKYSESVLDDLLDDLLTEIAVEEAKKKKKKKPKKISKKVDAALKKKAKKYNAPLGALKAVYRKGMGAFYTSGARPGQSAHSWAMGRVNSFLKGGKARKVDSAQWNQVKKHRKK